MDKEIEKINENISLLEKQKEREEIKYQISTSIQRLVEIDGKEAVKTFLSKFPTLF